MVYLLVLLGCAPLEPPALDCEFTPTGAPLPPVDSPLSRAGGTLALTLPGRFVQGGSAHLEADLLTLAQPTVVEPDARCTRSSPHLQIPVLLRAEERRSGWILDGVGTLYQPVDDPVGWTLRVVLPAPLSRDDDTPAGPPLRQRGLALVDLTAQSFAVQTCTRIAGATQCTPEIAEVEETSVEAGDPTR